MAVLLTEAIVGSRNGRSPFPRFNVCGTAVASYSCVAVASRAAGETPGPEVELTMALVFRCWAVRRGQVVPCSCGHRDAPALTDEAHFILTRVTRSGALLTAGT